MITTSRILQAAILLLLPAAGAFGEEPTNTLPIDQIPAAAAWMKAFAGETKPTIVPISSTPAPDGTVRLLLVNPTDQLIEYGGYTVGSWAEAPPVGQISPLYQRERLSEAGEWQDHPLGWCGTGADTMVVPPGHAGEFSAHVATEGQSRVGFRLTQKGAEGPRTSDLWSPTLGTAAVAAEVSLKDEQAPAKEITNTLPIERFPAAATWRDKIEGEAKPGIVVVSAQPAGDPAQLDVRLILINPTDQPIEYIGYTIDSWQDPPPAGEIHPFYRGESMNAAGEWVDDTVGRCGTGKGTIAVPPGHAGQFDAQVPAGAKTRIGVNLMPSDANGMTIVEVWSPTLGAAGEEVPTKAP